jgi:hypothetical protein
MYILGAFGLLDFTMLRPVLAWRAVWNLWTVYLFNFPVFFGLRQTADTESADTGARLYNCTRWGNDSRALNLWLQSALCASDLMLNVSQVQQLPRLWKCSNYSSTVMSWLWVFTLSVRMTGPSCEYYNVQFPPLQQCIKHSVKPSDGDWLLLAGPAE